MNHTQPPRLLIAALLLLLSLPRLFAETPAEALIKLLLKHGADTMLLNSERRSALMLAESEGHAGIVKLLPAR